MKKVNGFTQKLHLFQIISYVFFFSVALTYFFITFPLSSKTSKIIGCILEALSGIVVIVSGYIATSTDPSDPYLKLSRAAHAVNKSYEPPSREFYCSSDHTYVKGTSKHCRRCNRCTDEFDHHCKWINNDVGKANYKAFFVLITSVMVFLSVYLIFGIIVTVNYANDSLLIDRDIFYFEHKTGSILAGMVILWIFMAFSAAFVVLDANLVLFHIYLTMKGLTTFQYITAVQDRKEFKKELDYAMKILGKDKKTCLDFILCLRKRNPKAPLGNKSFTIQGDTPGNYENKLEEADEEKRGSPGIGEDLESRGGTRDKPTMDNIQNENESQYETPEKQKKEENCEIASPGNIKTSTQSKNFTTLLLDKPSLGDYNKEQVIQIKGHEKEQGITPVVVNIESESGNKKGFNSDENFEVKAKQIIVQTQAEEGQKINGPTIHSNRSKKKKSSKGSYNDLTENDEKTKPLGKHNSIFQNHQAQPRSLAYSVEKEKGDFVTSGGNTQRSNYMAHTHEVYRRQSQPTTPKQIVETEDRLERSYAEGKEEKAKTDIAIETYREVGTNAI